MPSAQLFINSREPIGPNVWTRTEGLIHLRNYLDAIISGHRSSDSVKFGWNDSPLIDDLSYLGQANGLIVFASSSGAVGATIGGTLVTVTWATSDTASASALAAAIRANATVNPFITASNLLAQLTCVSVVAGTTVQVGSTVFTGIANGATPAAQGQFSVGASDTACALNLVNAINRHPSMCGRFRAASIAGVVFIGLPDNRTPLATDAIRNPSATTITVNAAIPVAGARTMLFAAQPGQGGRFITAVASGTNVTYATNGTAGQLGNGTGALTPAFTNDVVP